MKNEIMIGKVLTWLYEDADVAAFEDGVMDILAEAYEKPLKEVLVDYINDKIVMFQEWEDEDLDDIIKEGQALIQMIQS